MPLEEPTLRLAFLLRDDLAALEARTGVRISRGEYLTLDGAGRLATWHTRTGDVVGRHYVERLAVWARKDRMVRWGWVGRGDEGPLHVEAVEREAHARDAPQLAHSVVGDVDQADAEQLARLGAVLCGAHGFIVQEDEEELRFLGLFDRPRPIDRFSIPPPPRTPLFTPRDIRPFAAGAPSPIPAVDREGIVPVSNAAVARLSAHSPGFQQGLLVVMGGGAPATVMLVTVDLQGMLALVEPGTALVDAARALSSSAAFQRITARIVPKPDGGASLHVDIT